MTGFFAVLLLTLGLGLPLYSQQHTKVPATSTQSATPRATPAPKRRTTRRRTRKTATRPAPAPKPTPAKTNSSEIAWSIFTSKAGRFSVLLPGTPTETIETKQSDQGPYTTYLYILREQGNGFLIGWVDYDPTFNFNRQLELEMNRDKFIENQKAKLVETRQIRIDGFLAIEFTAETTDQIFRSRVYMVGRRPYQIIISSPKGLDDSANVNRFFNSFKVTAS